MAQALLVASLGAVNECSMYTHANLSEVHLRKAQRLPQLTPAAIVRHHVWRALSHLADGCGVGAAYHGVDHPNTARKMRELGELLEQIGAADLAVVARRARARGDMLELKPRIKARLGISEEG